MKFRRTRVVPFTIVPFTTVPVDASTRRNNSDGFRTIFIAALLIGLPVPYSLWATKIKTLDISLQVWNTLMVFARTIFLAIYWWRSRYFWQTISTQVTFDTQNLAGYAVIWIFILKRRDIRRSLKKMFALLSKLGGRRATEMAEYRTKTKLFLCATVLGCLVWTAVQFFYFGAWDSFAGRLKLSLAPHQRGGPFQYYLTWIFMFSLIFTYYVGTATLYVSLIVCAHAYRCCGQLLRLYGEKKLQIMAETKNLTSNHLSRNLVLFRRLGSCVRGVDGALSLCAGVIYAAVFNDMFTVFSVLFSGDRHFGSLENAVFMALKALAAFCMFFYLTYSGESVAREKVFLERTMIQASTCVMRPFTTTALAEIFHALQSSVRSTDVSVTLYDFFDINRKLVLSATGFFLTYGVYLYNFAASEQS